MNPKIQNYIISKDTNNINNININTNLNVQNDNPNNYLKMGTIFRDLMLMGYSIDSIACCFDLFHFSSVSEAVYLMSKDPDTNLYIHHFVSNAKNRKTENENRINVGDDLCLICKDKKKYHNNIFFEQINDEKKILSTMNNNSINNESKNNMITNEDNCIKSFLVPKNLVNSKLIPCIDKKLINELSKTFDDKENLCLICYDTIMSDDNSYILPCKHQFCRNCISHYLISEIKNCRTNIHCLHPDCPFIFTKNLIENFTPTKFFKKYCFLNDKIDSMKNRPKGCIPCIYPDCKQWVEYNLYDEDPFVTCPCGHSFCALCKGEVHKGKMCAFQELKNTTKKKSKIKLCPRCCNLIERKNSNIMKCPFCGYKFCWLCLKEYTIFHYMFFNIYGCPGLESSDPETSNLLNNDFLSIFCFIISFILFLIILFICIGLYIFFGAIYELIVWYNLRDAKIIEKRQKKRRMEIYNKFVFENINTNSGEKNNKSKPVIICGPSIEENEILEKKSKGEVIIIYLGLIILGIIGQPFLLLFKLLEYMSFVWKRFKCFYFCFRFHSN